MDSEQCGRSSHQCSYRCRRCAAPTYPPAAGSHAIDGVIEAAILRIRSNSLGADCNRARIRLIGHELYRAAHRTRTVQCALRSAQNLDAVKVIKRRVDYDAP